MTSLLLAALPVAAQTIYKSTMPDGKVIYGEKPAPGALRTEEIKPPPRETGVRPPASATGSAIPRRDPAQAAQTESNLRAAEEKLREAQEALEKGKEPLPGERSAGGRGRSGEKGAGGERTSFLNESYWERQKKLETGVEEARKEVERFRQELGTSN